jgi:hypothetical protein
MSQGHTKNSALTTALAFHFQMLIGLEKCFLLEEGQSIFFEKDGDVSLISPDSSASTQTEVKNYADPLTDHHENLWKTIKNWLAPEFNHKQYGTLILHTTQAFGKKSSLKHWNTQNAEQRLQVLQDIFLSRPEDERNTEKLSGVIKLQKTVLDTNEILLTSILNKVTLITETESAEEIGGSILKMINGIPNNNLHKYLEWLIGFIYAQATQQSWSIRHNDFTAKCEEITALLCKKEFTFPPFSGDEASDVQIEQHQDNLFVQKISEIEHYEMIPDAIGSWLELQNSLIEELDEFILYKDKTLTYQNQLVKKYKLAHSSAQLEVKDTIKSSKLLYNTTIGEQPMNMGNDIPPIEYKNGLIHDAMDDEERNLKWRVEP